MTMFERWCGAAGGWLQTLLETGSKKKIGAYVLLLGALMTLGFAPFFVWPLALVSVAGLYWLVSRAASRTQAAGAALVWGLGHQVTALYWLPRAFYLDAQESYLAGIFGGIPAMLAVALYGALGMVLVAVLARTAPMRWRGVVFVAAWMLLDMLKATTPYGFPWLPAGAVWGGDLFGGPVLAQLASVGGVFLLSALVLTAAVLLTGGRRGAWACAALLLAVGGFGAWRLHGAPQVSAEEQGQKIIRMVQPNVQSAHKWDPVKRLVFLRQTLDVAFNEPSKLGNGVPDAVVMPETAVAFFMETDPDLRQVIAARMAAPASGTQVLLTGTVGRTETRNADGSLGVPVFANSFAALDNSGRILGSYDKVLLVPFGEFIPGRALLDALPLPVTLRTFSQSRLDFSFGTKDPRLLTPAGTVESLICYEGIFPWYVARHSQGADWLVNITNDNWFTGTTALFQHATLARLRSIETGLPLIRVANTGLTIAYDGYGREVTRLPINTATYADLALPAAPRMTGKLARTIFVKLTAF